MKSVWLGTLGLALASAAVWPWWGSGTLAQTTTVPSRRSSVPVTGVRSSMAVTAVRIERHSALSSCCA